MLRATIHKLAVPAVATLLVAWLCPAAVSAAGRNNGAAAAAARQRTIAALQAQLGEARQVLASAQAEANAVQGKIDESKSRVETAKGCSNRPRRSSAARTKRSIKSKRT